MIGRKSRRDPLHIFPRDRAFRGSACETRNITRLVGRKKPTVHRLIELPTPAPRVDCHPGLDIDDADDAHLINM